MASATNLDDPGFLLMIIPNEGGWLPYPHHLLQARDPQTGRKRTRVLTGPGRQGVQAAGHAVAGEFLDPLIEIAGLC